MDKSTLPAVGRLVAALDDEQVLGGEMRTTTAIVLLGLGCAAACGDSGNVADAPWSADARRVSDAGVTDASASDARLPDVLPPDAQLPDAPVDGPGSDAASPPDAIQPMPDAPPDAVLPPPTASSIWIVGGYGGSTQLRQGAGDVIVIVTGTNLTYATGVSVRTYSTTLVSSNQSSATLIVNVPHGAMLGPADVVVTTTTGSATLRGALNITEITSSARRGDDSSGQGTLDSPFRTATRAVQLSSSGDMVELQAGIYAVDSLDVGRGVTIHGDGSATTIQAATPGSGGIHVSSGAIVSDLQVRAFFGCLQFDDRTYAGPTTAERLLLDGCTVGITVTGDRNVRISSVLVSQGIQLTGVNEPYPDLEVLIENTTVFGVVSIYRNVHATITGTVIMGANGDAVLVDDSGSRLTIREQRPDEWRAVLESEPGPGPQVQDAEVIEPVLTLALPAG
jgi:hypothetical protein